MTDTIHGLWWKHSDDIAVSKMALMARNLR